MDAIGPTSPSMHLTSSDDADTIANLRDAFVDDAYLGVTFTFVPEDNLPMPEAMRLH